MIEIKEGPDGWMIDDRPLLPSTWVQYRVKGTFRAVQIVEPFTYQRFKDTRPYELEAGDWLVLGSGGDIYPLRDEFFRACYELVSSNIKLLAALEHCMPWMQREPVSDMDWHNFNAAWSEAKAAIAEVNGG